MDIKILHSWLLEYLQTNAEPLEIGRCLALCGPSVEKVEQWGKQDYLYSIEVTTNRVDMMSVYGIAREAAVILPQFGYRAALKPLSTPNRQANYNSPLPLQIKTDPNLTNRAMAQIMQIKTPRPETPSWMKERLEAADIRSLNLIVDITNYVMLEIGHPTHVFDYDRIKSHKMIFRPSKKGERVKTLDDKNYILHGGDSVIDDGTGVIIDLPGIMGTANSVVTDETKTIIFFIDNNNPKLMRQTSMQHGIRTSAVTLNEKHVSPELAEIAMQRGIQLYQQLCDAKPAAKLIDIYDQKPKTKSIEVPLLFIEDRLGVSLDPKFVTKTLGGLGFITKLIKATNSKFTTYNIQFTTPYWRNHDISIPEDIVEELARIYGYHNLPSILPTGELPKPNPQQEQFVWEQKIKSALKYWGFYESYSYSLVSKDLIESFDLDLKNQLKLKNPLSTDWEYLRNSLIPSLLTIIGLNQNKVKTFNVFEMANVYTPVKDRLPQETLHLCLSSIGHDFFYLKGIIENLCAELGIQIGFQISRDNHWLETDKQVSILVNNIEVGFLGQLKTVFQIKAKIVEPVFIADFDFEKLVKYVSKNKTYTPIPKYPPIIEQYTFINETHVAAAKILAASSNFDSLINKVEIAGVYENKITVDVTFLDNTKNLSDEEVKKVRKGLVREIEKMGLKLQGYL